MKKLTITSLMAVAAAALALACPARAGILTVEDGPNFTPEGSFTNNTIEVDTTIGEGALIHIVGSATVTPPEGSDIVSIDVSGTYSANAGDMFSGAYSFSADLNSANPVGYTISGTVTIDGIPVPFTTTGTIEPGLHRYEGTFEAPTFIVPKAGNFMASLVLDFGSTGAPTAAEPSTLDLAIQQIDFKLDPLPATIAAPSISQNISTRADVGVDTHVLIGGFIITGNDAKTVILRGIGPSLAVQVTGGVLADPVLELHDSTGATIATNDNWMDLSAEDQTTLSDNNLAPADDAESALVMTLDPDQYTLVLRGANDTTGIGLVEAYDIDDGATDSQFANISTRGFVQTGESQMIGGFILGGGGAGFSTVVVRAIGPSLADDSIVDPLADPFLELHDANGDTIDSNDNWMDDPNMEQVSDAGLAPDDSNESALYKILPAGEYTAVVSGVGGTTGVALVESYNLDATPAP
ncbi:MAG TPA: hypothetical protein VH207_08400 [Chthoniobacterales bacterium]|jgi:hypothetical protein|nr:hypothetical protein [Chthoniobacterales bacterium]